MTTNNHMWDGINYNEVFPRSFYEVPYYSKAMISTCLGQHAKRQLVEPFPAQVTHSDYHADVIEMAYQLRCQHPKLLSSIKTPRSWNDLYEYYDSVDLWTQGPRFLMCVLDYIERFCGVFEVQDGETEFNQIRELVTSWGSFHKNTILASTSDQELAALFYKQYEPARDFSPRQHHNLAICLGELRQQVFHLNAKESMAAPLYNQQFQGVWQQPQTTMASPVAQFNKSYQQFGGTQQSYLGYNNGMPIAAPAFYTGGRINSPMGMGQGFYHAPIPPDVAKPIYAQQQQHRLPDRRAPPYDSSFNNSPHRSKIPNGRVSSAPVSSPQHQQDRLGGGAKVVYARKESFTHQRRRNQDYHGQHVGSFVGPVQDRGNPKYDSAATPNPRNLTKNNGRSLSAIVEHHQEDSKESILTLAGRKDSAVDMTPPRPNRKTTKATKTRVPQDPQMKKKSANLELHREGEISPAKDDRSDIPKKPRKSETREAAEETPMSSLKTDVEGDFTKQTTEINKAILVSQEETVNNDKVQDILKGDEPEKESMKSNLPTVSVTSTNIEDESSEVGKKLVTRFSYSQDSLPSPQIEVLYDHVEFTSTNALKSNRIEAPGDARLTNPNIGPKGHTSTCVHEEYRPSSMTLYYVDPKLVERDNENIRTAKFTGYNEHAVKSHLIMDMFSQCGPIEFVTYHPGRNLGFIQYATAKSVDEAIKTYSNWTMPNTTIIRVMYPQPPRRRSQGRGTSASSSSSICSTSDHRRTKSKDLSSSVKKENIPTEKLEATESKEGSTSAKNEDVLSVKSEKTKSKDLPDPTQKENLPTEQKEVTEADESKEQVTPMTNDPPKQLSKKKSKAARNQKKNNLPMPNNLAESDFPPLAPSQPTSTIIDGRPPRIPILPNKGERTGDKDWPYVKKCASK
ncbi:hypothetical protein PVAG01_02281 [Phlyctema vagabunda]|uniref:RRM domain-containing protein n=1 Tax=Phlyctema vagabunda TaxID=108571 RepID=A0ABR4PQA3_9HELO